MKPHTQVKVNSMATLRGQNHSTTLHNAAVDKAFAARDVSRSADKPEIEQLQRCADSLVLFQPSERPSS